MKFTFELSKSKENAQVHRYVHFVTIYWKKKQLGSLTVHLELYRIVHPNHYERNSQVCPKIVRVFSYKIGEVWLNILINENHFFVGNDKNLYFSKNVNIFETNFCRCRRQNRLMIFGQNFEISIIVQCPQLRTWKTKRSSQ